MRRTKAEIKGVRRWIIMRVLGRMRVVPAGRRVREELWRERSHVGTAGRLVEVLYGVRGDVESTELGPSV